MGLERTAAVLQGVATNYHIDILRPLVEAAGERLCGVRYDPESEDGRRLRRIADHVRACYVCRARERLPGSEQGEVRHQAPACGAPCSTGARWACKEPTFLHKLVDNVAELMAVPLIPSCRETVKRVCPGDRRRGEPTSSTRIDAGLDRINRVFEAMKKEKPGDGSPGPTRPRCTTTLWLSARTVRDHGGRAQLDVRLGRLPRAEMERHGIESGGGKVTRRSSCSSTIRSKRFKKAMHGSRVRRLRRAAKSMMHQGHWHHRWRKTLRPGRRDRPRAAPSPSCWTRRPSTARWADRSATTARSAGTASAST